LKILHAKRKGNEEKRSENSETKRKKQTERNKAKINEKIIWSEMKRKQPLFLL
jgi:hypothetical protein